MKKYTHTEPVPEAITGALSSYPALLQRLLHNRGITNRNDAEVFLHPSYERGIHDPYLLTGMDKAVKRIECAISNDERITIYSDYDHDGIPGAVVLASYFDAISFSNYSIYIPHRNKEGFGLNKTAMEKLHEEGTNLVITIDLGITGNAEVDVANGLGMDVIITDHHVPGELPDAYEIINPKMDDEYPFDGLSGSGVIWKVVQALRVNSSLPAGWEKRLLDLVGIATLADMVPLTGENRVIVFEGLKQLRKTKRPGLVELLRVIKLKQAQLSEDDVVFMITPRINAVSRVDAPELALDLLQAKSKDVANLKAKALQKANDERKGKMASMTKSAKGKIQSRENIPNVLVIGDLGWEPGLLGLVAQKLAEEYERPVCAWGQGQARAIKGSCRGDGKTNLVTLMKSLPEGVLTESGGHVHAGGFGTTTAGCALLEQEINIAYDKGVGKLDTETNGALIEAVLDIRDVSWETYSHIEMCGPFGMDNPKPVFQFVGGTLHGVEPFGKNGEHLKIILVDDSGKSVEAIAFFTTPKKFSGSLDMNQSVHLLATLEKSTFRGFPELRLRIVDVL